MTIRLQEVDRVEIHTLQDNTIDIAANGVTDVVQRASSEDRQGNRVSILAEHGFFAVVSVYEQGRAHKVLFDFGFSETGALQNARATLRSRTAPAARPSSASSRPCPSSSC